VRLVDLAPSRSYPDRWISADVRDLPALSGAVAGCTTLYHLAGAHRDDVRPLALYHEVNVRGAEHACAAAEAHGIGRIVFVSSVAVYGLAEGELDESAPLRPGSEYGRSKVAAEQVFRTWAAHGPERSLTIVRPTVVFGPRNRGNVFELLAQVARGRAIVIGDGRNRKSLAYVANLADFLVYALRFGPGVHVYNYADKPDLDMNRLVAGRAAPAAPGPLPPRARRRARPRPRGAAEPAHLRGERGAHPQVRRQHPVRQPPLPGIRLPASP
jgi:nucleoside-diphosphate-sugar epimerase